MTDEAKPPRRVRRSWSDEEKQRMVAETRVPGVSVSAVARRHGLNANQLFNWIKDPRFSISGGPAMLPVDMTVGADDGGTPPRIDIELPNGVRLRCDARLDPRSLEQIVGVLRRIG